MSDYADLEVDTAPRWLRNPIGEALHYVYGLAKDAFAVGPAKLATKARFASEAPSDAIAQLLTDFQLDRPFNESVSATRARILKAWDTWALAGTKAGLLAALATAGYTNAYVQERVNRWWDFRVVLLPPFGWDHTVASYTKWNNGISVYNGGATYAQLGPPGERERVNATIQKWKPKNTRCVSVLLVLDGKTYNSPEDFEFNDGHAYAAQGDGAVAEWSLQNA
jgi:Phage tail protein (Tail_P2_I)